MVNRGEGGGQQPWGVRLTVRDEGEHRLFPLLHHLRYAVHRGILSLCQQTPRQRLLRGVVPARLGALQPPQATLPCSKRPTYWYKVRGTRDMADKACAPNLLAQTSPSVS
eukprot:COSAG04_NODE_2846_length_3492_cov_2.288830_3_plen_110_part_00